MPTTDVTIINMSLSHLGHTIFIDDRNEDSQEVAVSDVHYDQAVAYVLEDFAWGCARRYVTLGLVEEEPNDDWRFSYRYPVDTVKIRRVVTALGQRNPAPPPFVIASDDEGRLIYTDEEDAVVETTKLLTDPALFTAMLAEAISWWLAGLMATGLAKDEKTAIKCFAMYESVRVRAAVSDVNEAQDPPEEDSEAIRARL